MPTDTGMPPITVLSPADITRIRNANKQKGMYKVILQHFADSGEIYKVVDQHEYFAARVADGSLTLNGIVQSLKGNIEKHGKDKGWPEFSVAKATAKEGDPEHVYLINEDALAAKENEDANEEL